MNNLTTVSQGVQTRTFAYNSLSRLLSATNPESGTISYGYDPNGNLTSKTDARGVNTDYVYDALSRVTNRNYSLTGSTPPNYQASPNVTYFYDNLPNAKGKLTKVASSVSTTEYTEFDIIGRVKSHKQTTDGTAYTTGYTYNLSGALIEETYPSGRVVKNTLDNDGELQQVQSRRTNDTFRNYANGFNYTAAGAVSSMRLGNGRWENTQFNSRLQPTQIGLGSSASSQNLLKLNYDYGTTDNNGNVKSQIINTGSATFTQTYLYDSLNRLTEAKELNANNQQTWKQNFGYDRFGNRTTFTETVLNPDNTTTTNNQTPPIDTANNRFTTTSGFTYDLAGNVITDNQGRTFNYDGENKQTNVSGSSGTIGTYVYDGDGNRVKKIVPNGETTIFVYDADSKLVAEYSTIVESQQTAKVSYLTGDHLGSPRITTDVVGQPVSRRDLRPFGEEISRANYGTDSVRQKFTSYERDTETDLDFAQARMYAVSLGRFSGPDLPLISQEKSNPQTFSLYSYCINNPLAIVDPDGHRWYYRDVDIDGQMTRQLEWVNPNDDGSYTAPQGEGWQAFVAPEGGGEMYIGTDGTNRFWIGEDANGAPTTFSTRILATGATLPADEDLIGGAFFLKGTAKVLSRIGGGALAKWLFKEGAEEAVTRLTAQQIGKIGEDALAKYLGNLGGKKFFNTTAGRRIVDYFVKGAAHESKTGAASLTKFIRQQIAKDVRLLADKKVDEVTWHFFRSPVTGRIGPSAALEKSLKDAGIKILLHPNP